MQILSRMPSSIRLCVPQSLLVWNKGREGAADHWLQKSSQVLQMLGKNLERILKTVAINFKRNFEEFQQHWIILSTLAVWRLSWIWPEYFISSQKEMSKNSNFLWFTQIYSIGFTRDLLLCSCNHYFLTVTIIIYSFLVLFCPHNH